MARRSPSPARARRASGTWRRATRRRPDPGRIGFSGNETDPNPVPSWSAQEASDPANGPRRRPAHAARGRDPRRLLPARGRRVLQFPSLRRARPGGLAVGRLLARRPAESRLPGSSPGGAAKSTHGRSTAPRSRRQASRRGRPRCRCRLSSRSRSRDLRATSVAAFGATVAWRTSIPANVQVSYGLVDFGVPTVWATPGSGARRLDRRSERARFELQLPGLGQRGLGGRPARTGDHRRPHARECPPTPVGGDRPPAAPCCSTGSRTSR